jgi:hypothetical protein
VAASAVRNQWTRLLLEAAASVQQSGSSVAKSSSRQTISGYQVHIKYTQINSVTL